MRPAIDRNRRGFTLIEALVSVSVIGLLAALLLPAVQAARASARRVECSSRLRQLGLALNSYHASYEWFPALSTQAGSAGIRGDREFSVFARLLGQLDQVPMFNGINFQVPLLDPYLNGFDLSNDANRTVAGTRLAAFLCPADDGDTPAGGVCNFRASVGWSLTWVEGIHNGLPPFGKTPGISPFGANASATTDGLSNTAAFSEKLIGQPTGPAFDPRLDMVKGFIDPNSVQASADGCAAKADAPLGFIKGAGLAWFVGTMAQTEYNHLLPPNGPVSDCLVRGVSPPLGVIMPRSDHPGGINLGMADGSVRFVGNGIATELWRALGTRGGGEMMTLP
jgi:prepilin-type N-terminal cleavage/methylation domain-containing protein/prepilin-type processing-associated H-X9-DG protein